MFNFLNQIPIDKLRHSFGGLLLMFFDLFLYVFFKLYFPELFYYLGFFTILFAAAKELIYDKLLRNGNCEFLDWFYTIIPVLLVYSVVFIVNKLPFF